MKIKNAGFAARTLLMFAWNVPRQTRALRDDVLQGAVEIEGVAKELVGETPQIKGKSNASKGGISKWLDKLSKK